MIDDSTILDALGQTMLFGALEDEVLATLAKSCQAKVHGKGSMVVVAGDPGGTILVLASGRLKIVPRRSRQRRHRSSSRCRTRSRWLSSATTLTLPRR